MKSHIFSFLFSLVLIVSFSGCSVEVVEESAEDGTDNGVSYTISRYVDFATDQEWNDYDGGSQVVTGTTSTAFSTIGDLINMYETSDYLVDTYNFETTSTGEYLFNYYHSANGEDNMDFKTAFDTGVLLFPTTMEVGETITRDYENVFNGELVGGTVKVTLDAHHDTYVVGANTFSDVIELTWIYIDGVSTNAPLVSMTFWMLKDKGWIQTEDNIYGDISLRTDLAGNSIPDDSTGSVIAQNVSATDGTYADSIVVTWDAVAGATGYYVFVDDDNGGTSINPVASNTYTDTVVTSAYLYTYYVKAMVDGALEDASASDTGYVIGYTGAGVVTTNSAPVISSISNQTSDVNVAISSIVVSASDADGDTLTYSATDLPSGLSINTSTGTISGTPTLAGTYNVSVLVNDGIDIASTSFSYTVNAIVNEDPNGYENNSSSAALSLTLGVAVDDVIGDLDDWYKIDLLAGNIYEVSVNKFIDDGGIDIEAYTDPAGSTVPGGVSVDTDDLNETMMNEFLVSADTTYYFKVMNHYYGNSTMDVSSFGYKMNITAAVDDDTSANALAINLNSKYTNILKFDIDSTDWLKVNVNANTDYNITGVGGNNASLDLYYESDLTTNIGSPLISYSRTGSVSITPTINDVLYIKLSTISSYSPYWVSVFSGTQSVAAGPTLTLDKSTLSINESATGDIVATATIDGTTADTVSATSSDGGVATVEVSGNTVTVTGISAGSATITITSGSGESEAVSVTVSITANEGTAEVPVVLTLNEAHSARIGSVEDYSYYEFNTTVAGDYNVSNSLPLTDIYFNLYSGSIGGTIIYRGASDANSQIFTLDASTTYYLKATNNTGSDATFDLLVTAPIVLLQTSGNIATVGDIVWYSFDAIAGVNYQIAWEDAYQQANSSTYTADVKVSAYREDSSTAYFTGVDSGYNAPQSITAIASEKVMIKVEEYYGTGTSTFAVTATQQ